MRIAISDRNDHRLVGLQLFSGISVSPFISLPESMGIWLTIQSERASRATRGASSAM